MDYVADQEQPQVPWLSTHHGPSVFKWGLIEQILPPYSG